MNRCLDKKGTNLGLVSQYCPLFVQLQGDQVENEKIIQSWFCLEFVPKIFQEVKAQNRIEWGQN